MDRGGLLRTGILQLDLSRRSLGELVIPATQKVSPDPAELPEASRPALLAWEGCQEYDCRAAPLYPTRYGHTHTHTNVSTHRNAGTYPRTHTRTPVYIHTETHTHFVWYV